jgi:hypothetical protein
MDDYLPVIDPFALPAIEPFAAIDNFTMNYADMNRGVTPIFFIATVPHEALSEESGYPRFVSQEQVRILVAGDTLNQGVFPVTEEYKRRFADAYAKFKAGPGGAERHIEGTPLAQWPAMTTIHIKEFEALNIFTIEGLAEVSDGNINRHVEGRKWREMARAFLAQAKDSAAAQKFAAENERLREKMEEMQREHIAFRKYVEEKIEEEGAENQPKRRGRPPRTQREAEED